MVKKALVVSCLILASIAALTACNPVTTTVTQTTTSTTTVPQTTYTQTVSSTDVMNFLDGAKKVYNDTILGSSSLKPAQGIADSGLLSLTVQSDSVISMNGISYNYVAINREMPAEVKLGSYLIDFSRPNLVTTGGYPISIQIFNGGYSGVPFGTTFIYYYIPVQIEPFSVYLQEHTEGDLQFLFMDYYPSSSSQTENELWLVLIPTETVSTSTSKTTFTTSLSSIMVESPLSVNLGVGYPLSFTAIGTYSDGSTAEITSQVTWISSNPAVASISSYAVATGITVGTTKITASLSGVTSPAITLIVYLETRTPITP